MYKLQDARPFLVRWTDWMTQNLVPGMLVRHPMEPDWGLGQVQSVIGNRATINFENMGKLLIDLSVVSLTPAEIASDESGPTT